MGISIEFNGNNLGNLGVNELKLAANTFLQSDRGGQETKAFFDALRQADLISETSSISSLSQENIVSIAMGIRNNHARENIIENTFRRIEDGTASRGQVTTAQIMLKHDGFHEGKVDGIHGPITQDSFEKFSQDQLYQRMIYPLEFEVALETSGNTIRVDLESLGEETNSIVKQMVENGRIKPLSEEQMQTLHTRLQDNFSKYSMTVPGLSDDPTTNVKTMAKFGYVMIDPHEMNGDDLNERLEMRAKWEAAKDALEDSGAHISVIDGANKDGDLRETYTRDKAFVLGNNVYIPDPSVLETIAQKQGWQEGISKSYEAETDQIREFYKSQGYHVVDVEGAWFEGGNLQKYTHNGQNTLLFGMEPWQLDASAEKLLNAINTTEEESWKMLGVPFGEHYNMDDSSFYHLDLGMKPLPNGEFVIFPEFTDPETYSDILELVGEDNIIEIDKETAERYVTNFATVGNSLVMTDTTSELQETLEGKGYNIISPEQYGLDSFEFGKGGLNCITNEHTRFSVSQNTIH